MRDRIAAVISLAVVLPLLPPTADDRHRRSSRQRLRQLLQRAKRVRARGSAAARTGTARSTSAPTAPRAARCGDELRAVEVRAAQRDEQRARRRACGCRVDTTPYGRSSPIRPICRRALVPPRARYASCGRPEIPQRLAAIAEAAARLAVDLVILMPLAGDEHDVAPGRLRRAPWRWLRRDRG